MKTTYKNKLLSSAGLISAAILFIASAILVNTWLTSWRLDLTDNKLFTLSDGTLEIIENLDSSITLDFYFSKTALVEVPQFSTYGTRVRDMLEEYTSYANGNIVLNIIEPEPFSEAEDQAVASGLQSITINSAGDHAYFGLVGTNTTDDEALIPFFQIAREGAVEYDITKLIYNLANPKKRVVGIISSLPIFGDEKNPEWNIIKVLKDFFAVRNLGDKTSDISSDIDVLVVIHPKKFSAPEYYALDQYLLRGGHALIFADPLSETDLANPPQTQTAVLPQMHSDLTPLFNKWGIKIAEDKIVGDINAAIQVQAPGSRGAAQISYLPWLRLTTNNLSKADFSTSNLKLIHMGTVGSIEKITDSDLTITPLIQTSSESMLMERDLILFQGDPARILNNFKSEDKILTLAARLQGKVKTAYPEGRPNQDKKSDSKDKKKNELLPDLTFVKESELNVILVADSDILVDKFWIREQNFLGFSVPQTIANNADFIVNSVENLSGNQALISLRSREEYVRPFTKVENIRREAERKYQARQLELQDKLKQAEEKIRSLQQDLKPGETNYILSEEQSREIEKFRHEQVQTRKELRTVQHELRKNIDALGSKLRFINIGLIPLLIALFFIGRIVYQSNKHSKK